MSRIRQQAVVVGCVLAALLAMAGLFVTDYGIDPTTWLAGAVTAFLLFLATLDPWLHRHRAHGLSTDQHLDTAAEALAVALHSQWQAECRTRGLAGPQLLDLRWTATDLPVSDAPPAQAGRSDAVVGAFERQAGRRMVLIGEPGSGKSTVAMLLTIGLLDRNADGQIPVLFPLSTWDPTSEDLRAWMTRKLYEDHPALRNTELYGSYTADLLIERRRIFPVLDGLDTIPANRRAEAVRKINRAVPPSAPLLLTSRRAEFAGAVAEAGRIPGASVVELQPLDHEEVAGYVRASADAVTAARWEPVFLHLRDEPSGRLADTLSVPLTLWLASQVYGTGAAEPTELLDRGRFPDRAAIERRLVDGLLPVLFDRWHGGAEADGQLVTPGQAERALAYLAGQLRARGSREFAWWELRRSVPPVLLTVLGAAALGLLSAFGVAWLMTYASSPKLAPATGLGAGCVMAARTVFVSTANYRARSARQKSGLWRSLLLSSLVLGTAVGLVFGALYGLDAGLVVGLGLAVASALRFALASSAELTRASSPKATMARDRAVVWAGSLVLAVVFGAASALVFGPYQTGMVGLGFVSGLMLGFALSVQSLRWWWFTVARAWLALRGRLPWQLMAFLEDAHRRGVLRQAGSCYQFRHALIQDRLADRNTSASRDELNV
ncbi:NACHT domain-containing protein [Solihabitans fulvus]|uniref:NACHT domain-containing protein n=1 Tax=Solihabitans fulvus TaxID=1892852 RepID=UPI001CB75E08|nr:NACHT domain-containing protein [Solihabitans fulvus]